MPQNVLDADHLTFWNPRSSGVPLHDWIEVNIGFLASDIYKVIEFSPISDCPFLDPIFV